MGVAWVGHLQGPGIWVLGLQESEKKRREAVQGTKLWGTWGPQGRQWAGPGQGCMYFSLWAAGNRRFSSLLPFSFWGKEWGWGELIRPKASVYAMVGTIISKPLTCG